MELAFWRCQMLMRTVQCCLAETESTDTSFLSDGEACGVARFAGPSESASLIAVGQPDVR
jgi:hypothetical protein